MEVITYIHKYSVDADTCKSKGALKWLAYIPSRGSTNKTMHGKTNIASREGNLLWLRMNDENDMKNFVRNGVRGASPPFKLKAKSSANNRDGCSTVRTNQVLASY
jgi:hypothetical protein